jgi:hypothetical protein
MTPEGAVSRYETVLGQADAPWRACAGPRPSS